MPREDKRLLLITETVGSHDNSYDNRHDTYDNKEALVSMAVALASRKR